MFTACVEDKHRCCCLTDEKAEAERSFTQGHEGSWKQSWEKICICSEHWAVSVFLMGEKEGVGFTDKICVCVRKNTNAQNYNHWTTTCSAYPEHLKPVDRDLNWEAKPWNKLFPLCWDPQDPHAFGSLPGASSAATAAAAHLEAKDFNLEAQFMSLTLAKQSWQTWPLPLMLLVFWRVYWRFHAKSILAHYSDLSEIQQKSSPNNSALRLCDAAGKVMCVCIGALNLL